MSELQRNIDKIDDIRFSDNTSMYDWYKNEKCKLLEERKNNITPTKKRMEEIRLFVSLEKFINEIKNKNYIKYSKKIDEYETQIKKLDRNINSSDNICFSDGVNMFEWYKNESRKIELEISNKKTYSKFRIYEIMLFARIENLLYDIKINNVKRLSVEISKLRNPNSDLYEDSLVRYEIRCKEYSELIEDLGRNLDKYDGEYFSDGINMFRWYEREYDKYKKEDKNDTELTEERKIQRKLFINIIKTVQGYSTYEPSFEQKYDEYMKLIKKFRRNLKQTDKFNFKNTKKDMYSWFIYYDQKLNYERNNLEKPEGERLEKLICFAKIYDELYEQKRLKLSNK